MEKINGSLTAPTPVKHNWDYVKKLDEQINAKSSISGALSERIKLSARYRAQSMAIQHGADKLLKSRWDADLFKGSLQKYNKLNALAGNAVSGASAVTYESLVQHIRSGGAVNAFNWKGLIKSRGWEHVDHLTGFTEGSAKAIGKTVAMSLAKFFIIYDAYKDAKTTYKNSQAQGDNFIVSGFKSTCTACKELGKSLISWEAGALGAALFTIMLPGLGIAAALAGGILFGGLTGFMLEQFMPSPVKETVRTDDKHNPFI